MVSTTKSKFTKEKKKSKIMCKKINYYILSFQNFWSQNTKTIKKLIKCTSGRISSTTYPDGLKNTLDDKKKKSDHMKTKVYKF